jgi:ribosomal protein S18 acetylase RimI-like enzyme/catechol 2,3-dioxygenase-like lactoylglutathione lyase family enzyme
MSVLVRQHEGSRESLRPLFELAEDSARELDGYIDEGELLVAVRGEEIVGHLQLTGTEELEIKNMAVLPEHQRRGVGRALVEAAIERAREQSCSILRVATAAADVGDLRFYQRLGFRMRSIERDAFSPAAGYAPGLEVDGIELRDRVWLDLAIGDDQPLPAIQVRVARHTQRLDEIVRFYRDGIGLTEVGRFHNHDGYDGAFLELPGTDAHLEFTAGGDHPAPVPHPESLLVLYLGADDAVRAAAGRLELDPAAPANPYWAEHGLTFEDPDGFRVVLVPERWAG